MQLIVSSAVVQTPAIFVFFVLHMAFERFHIIVSRLINKPKPTGKIPPLLRNFIYIGTPTTERFCCLQFFIMFLWHDTEL